MSTPEPFGVKADRPTARILFQGLFDDAAVFPPGLAPLPHAVRDHVARQSGSYADLVGPLLLPVSAIADLLNLEHPPLEIGLIGRPGTSPALVGEALVKRFGWKIGDRIPLQSTIFPDREGSKNWMFDIVGVLHSTDKKTGGFFDQMFLLNWKYFDDTTPYNRGQVGWYVSRVADVNQADRVARTIDALSANSDHETRTQTEQAATASWMKQLADIGLIVGSIMGAVFFTLLLLSGNTMMQAVRERTSEIAVLKTIGFSSRSVLGLVLAESVLLLMLGGLAGLGLATVLIPLVSASSGGMLNLPVVGLDSWLLGIALMALIGVLVGALPALSAMRINIVDALASR